MSKNKLSKGQQRRVKANHQRRLKTTAEKADYDDNLFGETSEGIVFTQSNWLLVALMGQNLYDTRYFR